MLQENETGGCFHDPPDFHVQWLLILISQWVSVTTLRYFPVVYDSHIFLFQALELIHALVLA